MDEKVKKRIDDMLSANRSLKDQEEDERIIDATQPIIEKLFLEDACACVAGFKLVGAFKDTNHDDLISFVLAFIGMELRQNKIILKEKKEE